MAANWHSAVISLAKPSLSSRSRLNLGRPSTHQRAAMCHCQRRPSALCPRCANMEAPPSPLSPCQRDYGIIQQGTICGTCTQEQ